jgi:hypothetical protein
LALSPATSPAAARRAEAESPAWPLVEQAAAATTIAIGKNETARHRANKREIDTSWVGYENVPGPSRAPGC